MSTLCERCETRPALLPDRQRWFSLRVLSRLYSVHMSFSVMRRDRQAAPVLCRDCHQAEIRKALFALRVNELQGGDIDDYGLGDDER